MHGNPGSCYDRAKALWCPQVVCSNQIFELLVKQCLSQVAPAADIATLGMSDHHRVCACVSRKVLNAWHMKVFIVKYFSVRGSTLSVWLSDILCVCIVLRRFKNDAG